MKIAVVWKWWSGKSTVSTLFSLSLASQWYNILAIDADYNMDMATHLGIDTTTISTMNQDIHAFYEFVWVPYDCPGKKIVEALHTNKPFSIFPHDKYTNRFIYQSPLSEKISCIVVGSHSENMLFNKSCSHSYFKPLKHYLPTVSIPSNHAIVVDSVAGTDMVWYWLYLGVDAIIIAVEPTLQSINVHKQISHIANEFWIPVYCIINKRDPIKQYNDTIQEFLANKKDIILWYIPMDLAILQWNYNWLAPSTIKALDSITRHTIELLAPTESSLSRFDMRWGKTESHGN
jgi:CO dehydrogenase maturation factor